MPIGVSPAPSALQAGDCPDELPIAIIGAGPKAIAIAAKAVVLKKLGWSVPPILIIEKDEAGGAWKGCYGFTDGHQKLGTSPEKDIGFPYQADFSANKAAINNADVQLEMLRYSWQMFLISSEKHDFQKWVDRGKPAPAHKVWAEYLLWVNQALCRQTYLSVRTLKGTVTSICAEQGQWRLQVEAGGVTQTFPARGLVFTGTGESRDGGIRVDEDAKSLVFDGKNIWMNLEKVMGILTDKEIRGVAIIGSGETAGALAVALDQRLNYHSKTITVVCKEGMVFSRGETFQENALYSDPADWKDRKAEFRQQFIDRTDRGVFSQYVKSHLDHSDRIDHLPGTVSYIEKRRDELYLLCQTPNGEPGFHTCNIAIIAVGFNPASFFKLMTERTRIDLLKAIRATRDDYESLKNHIEHDLSIKKFSPPVHVPMLANFAQGPGFPNLSSLGRVADRILDRYIRPPTENSDTPVANGAISR